MLNLGAKMLVLSSSFILVLRLWVAIVMVILALFRQSFDCQLSVVVRGCMEVQGIFMVEFHVDGLIVIVDASSGLGDQFWVSVVSESRPGGLEAKI
jgi:hypothetical protein